jgi:hypothetical protein
MTPDALQTLVRSLDSALPGTEDPPHLLRELEALGDRRPANRAVAEAIQAAHGMVTAGDGLPATVGGVHREELVRWDGWTSTWDGPHLPTGGYARVRVLRAHAARDPVLRRALQREMRALQGALSDLPVVAEEGRWPALLVHLPGSPISSSAEGDDLRRPETLVRMLCTAVADLSRWERQRLGLPPLATRELLHTGTGIRIVCLTAVAPGDVGVHVARIAEVLEDWWGDGPESPVDALLGGLVAFPPRTTGEAEEQIRATLAEDLTDRRHRLASRERQLRDEERIARLYATLRRLEDAVPPPEGRGAVGVDMQGRTTVVQSREGCIRWGPHPDPTLVRSQSGALEVREARRLLRARAASPPNPRLQAEVGGDPEAVDTVCQWLSAAIRLRTVRKLLEASPLARRTTSRG